MRAKGYERFSRRVFHDRFERGKLHLGWIRKFQWNVYGSEPPALAGGMTRGPRTRIDYAPAQSETPDVRTNAGSAVAPTNSKDPADQTRAGRDNAIPMPDADFKKWLKRASPNMCWSWPHLNYLYAKLAEVTSGKTKRLMIFMPPRHGKSELVTVRYAAWRIRRDSALNVIIGSYNQHLANRFSRKVRITWEDSLNADTPQDDGEKGRKGDVETAATTGSAGFGGNAGAASPKKSSPSLPFSPSPALPTSRARLNTVSEWETGLAVGFAPLVSGPASQATAASSSSSTTRSNLGARLRARPIATASGSGSTTISTRVSNPVPR
jgi:Uncharacterized protein conserved in bacteria